MIDHRTVRIKICGITTVEVAAHVAAAGADAVGLMFYPGSSRYLKDLGLAREIAQAAGPLINVVALFVDPAPADVERVLSTVPISALQFHGDEPEALCRRFNRPYLKALRMKPELDVDVVARTYLSASGLLLDAYRPGMPGGTGETFDWQRIPPQLPRPLILAGGLNPSNVAAAVETVRPWAVDVSGGVESAPGIKDPFLIREFVTRAKGVRISLTNE